MSGNWQTFISPLKLSSSKRVFKWVAFSCMYSQFIIILKQKECYAFLPLLLSVVILDFSRNYSDWKRCVIVINSYLYAPKYHSLWVAGEPPPTCWFVLLLHVLWDYQQPEKMNLPYVYTQPFSIWLNVQFLFYRALDFTLLNHAEWRDSVLRQLQRSKATQDNYDHPFDPLHHIQFYLVKPKQFAVEAGYLF